MARLAPPRYPHPLLSRTGIILFVTMGGLALVSFLFLAQPWNRPAPTFDPDRKYPNPSWRDGAPAATPTPTPATPTPRSTGGGAGYPPAKPSTTTTPASPTSSDTVTNSTNPGPTATPTGVSHAPSPPTSDTVQIDLSALRSRALGRHPAQTFVASLDDYMGACATIPGCIRTDESLLEEDEIVYLGYTSTLSRDRFEAIRDDWLGNVRAYIFADFEDESQRVYTTDHLRDDPSYLTAMARKPHGLKALFKEERFAQVPTSAKWIYFVDDDTWVNTIAVQQLLSRLNPEVPLAIGHVWYRDYTPFASLAGGPGFIFSVAAARLVAKHVYETDECQPQKIETEPRFTYDDVFLTQCFHSVPDSVLVHTSRIGFDRDLYLHGDKVAPSRLHHALSLHKVFGKRHAEYSTWAREWKGCEYPKDFGGLQPATTNEGQSYHFPS